MKPSTTKAINITETLKRYDDLGILTKEGSYENDYINYEKEYYPQWAAEV